jgi:hypothetical protein
MKRTLVPFTLFATSYVAESSAFADEWVVNDAALPKVKDAMAEWRPDANGKRTPITGTRAPRPRKAEAPVRPPGSAAADARPEAPSTRELSVERAMPAGRVFGTKTLGTKTLGAKSQDVVDNDEIEVGEMRPWASGAREPESAQVSHMTPTSGRVRESAQPNRADRPRTKAPDTKMRNAKMADRRDSRFVLASTEFSASADRSARIQLKLYSSVHEGTAATVEQQLKEISVYVPGSRIGDAKHLLQLDTAYFDSPVESVRVVRAEGGLRVAIRLRQAAHAVLDEAEIGSDARVVTIRVSPDGQDATKGVSSSTKRPS